MTHRRKADDSEQKYNGIYHDVKDDGGCDCTCLFARKRKKNSGNQGGSHPGRSPVGHGEQQGIQCEGTRSRQETQASLIYKAPVYHFFRSGTEYAQQEKSGNGGIRPRRLSETNPVQDSAGESGTDP